MFPLIAIGGVIGAVVSAIQGASWLSDHLDSSKAASAGGKAAAKPPAEAKVSPFEAALAAQAAGQTLPGSGSSAASANSPTPATAIVPPIHGTDYDTLARMKAGIVAYSHIGERHGNHAGAVKPPGSDDNKPITQS